MEGKDIIIEWRSAEAKAERLPGLAAELVRLKVDIIITGGPTPTRAAKKATVTMMAQDADPVASGFVDSLARPGGNITGLSTLVPELSGKQLDLLKEILPKLTRVAVFGTSTRPGNAQSLKEVELSAGAIGVKLQYLDVLVPRILRLHSEPQARGVLTQSLCSWRAGRIGSPIRDCRTCGKESATGDLRQGRICEGRGPDDVHREQYRLVSARSYVCRQDFERRKARRFTG